MSVTRPTLPPKKVRPPLSLRARWRFFVMVSINLLLLAVVGGASLVLFFEQRQSLVYLHESTARQTRTAVQQSMADTLQLMAYISQTDTVPSDLQRLQNTQPALREISLIDSAGDEVSHVPPREGQPAPDWTQDPAWIAASAGQSYTGLIAGELVLAVPTNEGGVLIAQTDAQALLRSAVSTEMGRQGYVYLLSEDGTVLVSGPKLAFADPRLPHIPDLKRIGPSLKLYRGIQNQWVVGRAELIPGSGFYVVTETPLSELLTPLVRGIALWVLAITLTVIVGEWLLHRILRTVLKPLDVLRQGARAVGTGDYRYRIRLPADTDRELADLGRAFNEMIDRLQESQEQIDSYTHEMEEIVDLRARELSRKALQLETAAEVSRRIATIHDPRALIDEIIELVQSRFKIYYVEVLLVDTDTGMLVPSKGKRKSRLMPISLQDETTSVVAWVARHGQTLYVPYVSQESRYRYSPETPASQCELAIPLRFGGRVTGVLNMESEHRNSFPKDEIAVLESLANEVAGSLHNAEVFDALEKANRDLAQTTLQAKQGSMLKSRFLLNAAQKLRAPLDAIIGSAEVLLSGVYGALSETAQERQRLMLENGRQLQALIADMIDFSSIETGHLELSLGWVDLEPLLNEIMNATRALCQTAYADHSLTVRLNMEGELPPVWADLDRLRYILINLMSNAVKFTESGEVVLSTEVTDSDVLIRVKDTGPGIRDDQRAHLFEPFQHQRTGEMAEDQETGLGLPVARMLALLHGGDLTVDSMLHQGSTFTLQLPRRPEGAPPPPGEEKQAGA
jgi:signal transduction histidine kinase